MKDKCTVINKSSGRVVYRVPEMNVRREFYPQERKVIEVKELEQLVQRRGGLNTLYNYLMIEDPEVARHVINAEIAPEYWFTEANLPTWINTSSLDEFKDALDFAPRGTKDLIKSLAVSMPLNDYSKRNAIKEQLGFDVDAAIKNSAPDEDEKKAPNKPAQRRVQPAEPAQRRVPVSESK